MFDTFIVQPIFNLLVLIYALLPGHNFGLAIILFTIVIRFLLWPLLKKQIHHARAMRELQPELRRIKKEAKGDRQKESMMVMAMYKEREINPFGSIGIIILQIPILIGLYIGLSKVVKDPRQLVEFSYPFLQDIGWMKELAGNIKLFDETLFGVVDLSRAALGPEGLYVPGMIIVVGSAVVQFFQSKQLMPNDKEAKTVKQVLQEAKDGKQAEAADLNVAVSRNMLYVFPVMILFVTVNLPSGLGLYWLVGGVVAYLQQTYILRQDVNAIEKKMHKTDAIEGEVVPGGDSSVSKTKKPAKKKPRNKRRKK